MRNALLAMFGTLILFVLVVGVGGGWLVRWVGNEATGVKRATHADLYAHAVAGLKTVVVRVNRGDVKIHPEVGATLRASLTRVGAAKDADEAGKRADAIGWTQAVVGDTLRLEVTVPPDPGFADLGPALTGGAYQATLELFLPAGPGIDVGLETGNLTAVGVAGGAKVQLGTGDADLTNVSGTLALTAGTGDVTITRGAGATTAAVGTGDLRIQDRPGPALDARTTTGNLDWAYAAAEPPMTNRLETQTGNLTVSAGPKADLALELEAGVGRVMNDARLKGQVRATGAAGSRASLVAGKPTHKLNGRTGTGQVLVEGPRGG